MMSHLSMFVELGKIQFQYAPSILTDNLNSLPLKVRSSDVYSSNHHCISVTTVGAWDTHVCNSNGP